VGDLATSRRIRIARRIPATRRVLWLLGWGMPIVLGVAFSPDGTKLAATCRNGMAALMWDLATGRQLPQLIHDDVVVQVAFSSDGTRIATASADNTARV
jgi:WD40 repeat protein